MKNGVGIEDQASLKEQQPALSIDDQVENLEKLGLIIQDKNRAKEILNTISYYRLIKAYGAGLKEKNSDFNGQTSFDDILSLYHFNSQFRQILFSQIEKIEVTFRCRLANYLCETYGVLFYNEPDLFENKQHYESFISGIYDDIARNRQSPVVKNFQNNYIDGQIPFYALVEILSFGAISKLYKNLAPSDKKAIAKSYNIGWVYLESWMESIAYVRNICAHYGRLYNIRLDKTPKLSKEAKAKNISNIRIFGIIYCISLILPKDLEWLDFIETIDNLLMKYANVDKNTMGFPDNWQELLKKV